jgi:hypothetical protein
MLEGAHEPRADGGAMACDGGRGVLPARRRTRSERRYHKTKQLIYLRSSGFVPPKWAPMDGKLRLRPQACAYPTIGETQAYRTIPISPSAILPAIDDRPDRSAAVIGQEPKTTRWARAQCADIAALPGAPEIGVGLRAANWTYRSAVNLTAACLRTAPGFIWHCDAPLAGA